MKKPTILKIGLVGLIATFLPLARAGIANADYAATPYDLVGIGGDTPQYTLDFLANGDADGDPGFNATGDQRRLVTFDAEPDANGRAAYYGPDEGSEADLLQYPTQVLREGEHPTQRNTSSGNAILSLENDTSDTINFIFSSSALSSSTSYTPALHEYEFGTDSVQLAADTTTNAPSGLTDADLAGIYEGTYTAWNQIPGESGASSATIVPLLPPSSSAITKTFLSAIGITQSQVDTKVVQSVEQNDPTAITLNTSSANAIVPFSQARYLLLKGSGASPGPASPYFPAIPGDSTFVSGDEGETYPAQPAFAPPIQLLESSATTTVTDYIDVRESDLSDTGSSSEIEPGSTVNWATYLFAGTSTLTPYIETAGAQALILDSGVTPAYADEGEFS